MKYIFIILVFFVAISSCNKKDADNTATTLNNQDTSSKNFTYLALGDSYTIGQNVPPEDNYPNKAIRLLKEDHLFGQLKIIATTGWTTLDLKAGIEHDSSLLKTYDFVTLLIGVNNQYQGMPIENYKPQFEDLLKNAISFAGSDAKRVIVFSMPDWGVTPFANGRDRVAIAKEIDAYNAINKGVSQSYGVHYIDITPWTREAANDLSLLEPGGLHPSGKEYARWAIKLEEIIKGVLRK